MDNIRRVVGTAVGETVLKPEAISVFFALFNAAGARNLVIVREAGMRAVAGTREIVIVRDVGMRSAAGAQPHAM
jgi:hypothetical protein